MSEAAAGPSYGAGEATEESKDQAYATLDLADLPDRISKCTKIDLD